MKITFKQSNRKGSALLLVIVLTVLLAAIASMFILMTRINVRASSSAEDDRNLTAGVNTVVETLERIFVNDLFDSGATMNQDADKPDADNLWLSTVEPYHLSDNSTPSNPSDDIFVWKHISKLWGGLDLPAGSWYDPSDYTNPAQWDGSFVSYDYEVVDDGMLLARIIDPRQTTEIIQQGAVWGDKNYMLDYGASADADGDGVSDSRWMRIPGLVTSKGKYIYAAVRVIDNCGLLNLDTVYDIDDTNADYYGKYLSEVDYEDFLRGYDTSYPDRIRIARDPGGVSTTPQLWHDNVIMNIENPSSDYMLFDIFDELEIRNRFLLTSNTVSYFEAQGVAYDTFDWGSGTFTGGSGYQVSRIPFTSSDFTQWKQKFNHLYFTDDGDSYTLPGEYDRRHVCTFYSFDRNLQLGEYPDIAVLSAAPGVFLPVDEPINLRNDILSNTIQARANILHLLYALRAYYRNELSYSVTKAAQKSAQVLVNMIDYLDIDGGTHPFEDATYGSQDPADITYINKDIIEQLVSEVSGVAIDFDNIVTNWPVSGGSSLYVMSDYNFGLGDSDILYGYERQPFITELYVTSDGSNLIDFAIELYNPYPNPNGTIDLKNSANNAWRIRIDSDTNTYDLGSISIGPGERYVLRSSSLVTVSGSGGSTIVSNMQTWLTDGSVLELQVPDPANPGQYLTVDKTDPDQLSKLVVPVAPPGDYKFGSVRADTGWEFTNFDQHQEVPYSYSHSLGKENYTNDPDSDLAGYQLPVANKANLWGTLLDFVRMPLISNGTDETITERIAKAADESDVRYDYKSSPELFNYISMFDRPNRRIPGRININTATREVIRAAIPESVSGADWNRDSIADDIIANRPYVSLSELYNDPNSAMFAYTIGAFEDTDDIGETSIDDFEERDWIMSLVFNKFTVRSDTFTAYILVRIGVDGPQRRMIAVFDRSEVYNPDDKPRLVALHPVPDPR